MTTTELFLGLAGVMLAIGVVVLAGILKVYIDAQDALLNRKISRLEERNK